MKNFLLKVEEIINFFAINKDNVRAYKIAIFIVSLRKLGEVFIDP